MAKNKSVFGIYLTRGEVESAVTALRDGGFPASDISVLLPENLGSKELATEKSTKAPEGASVGAGSGAAVGGVLGWLVGVGALAIPGVGPVIAAGPIVAALAGIGAGGALGGFAGALIGVGIPEYEAKRYEGRVLKGGILVAVHCDTSEEIKRAKGILEVTGAEDIASAGEASADRKTAA
ncbi:MAG: DUF3341 domain-containing protein [Candidatus Sulfotelmatobacter sp.]|jgi:hypothetical protein